MLWFRFYSEVLRDPKVQRLPAEDFRGWINLLCLASEQSEAGTLPALCDIAFALRLGEARTVALLARLTVAGLLDTVPEPLQVTIHSWARRQFLSDDVTLRVRKYRRSRNVTVTPSDSDTEQNRSEAEADADAGARPRRNIFVLHDRYMGKPSITGAMRDLLVAAEEEYGADCIEHCYEMAAKASDGRRSWGYVEAILKRHQQEGCDATRTGAGQREGLADHSLAFATTTGVYDFNPVVNLDP